MKVKVQKFEVDMELGNNGITLDVSDPQGNRLGDLRIGRAKIEWCEGQTQTGNGKIVDWKKFIKWINAQ